MLNEDQIYEIEQDVYLERLKEEWLSMELFMDRPMVDLIHTDLFYNDQQKARHILKFLQYLRTDEHISYKQLRYQRLGI